MSMTEATIYGRATVGPIQCPSDGKLFYIPWKCFCDGLAWTGNPATHKIFAVCLFECPQCGENHQIRLPEDT